MALDSRESFRQLQDDLRVARPRLLVSVRNVEEAETAISGGAAVIDVKEPARGPLGAADPTMIARIVTYVSGRVPVTAAAGELIERNTIDGAGSLNDLWHAPPGLTSVKLGLAGLGAESQWPLMWKRTVERISPDAIAVAVVYADWPVANAPRPDEVLAAAINFRAPAILVDTFCKDGKTLLDHWPSDQVRHFLQAARAANLMTVLAGSLHGDLLRQAASTGPDLIAVRGAVCSSGRCGAVSLDRIRAVSAAIGTTFALRAAVEVA